MLIDHDAFRHGSPRPNCWSDLPGDEGLILWSMRRMVVAWPRCHAVHAALHARYGDDGLGIEHLLRCWLTGVSRHARRQLVIGDPLCGLLMADEGAMLFILRSSTPAPARTVTIEALTGNPCSPCLMPLAESLGKLAQL